MQEEAASAAKVREHTLIKLQQLEKQKGAVEQNRDELKASLWGKTEKVERFYNHVGCMTSTALV